MRTASVQQGLLSTVAAGQHDDCHKTEALSAVDGSVTFLSGGDALAYAGKSDPAESSQSLSGRGHEFNPGLADLLAC